MPSWSKNLLTRFHGSGDEKKNIYCYVASFINIRMFVNLLDLEFKKFKIEIFKKAVFYCMQSLIKYFHNFVIIL